MQSSSTALQPDKMQNSTPGSDTTANTKAPRPCKLTS